MADIKVAFFKATRTGDTFEVSREDDLSIDRELLGDRIKPRLMHQMVVGYGHHKRVGTHATKSRGMVAGSNKKPWRQKGTGRARAGSRKSPLWRGGGVIFGPSPRTYDTGLPRKMRHAALDSALLAKMLDGELFVVDGLRVDGPKTRLMASFVQGLAGLLAERKIATRSLLLATNEHDPNMVLSCRNLAKVKLEEWRNVNAYDVVRKMNVVLSKDAFEQLIADRTAALAAREARRSAAPATA